MDLFLKILGFICLLGLLLIAAVLFFIGRLRKGLHDLSQMAQEAGTPSRLHLVPVSAPGWKDPEKVAGVCAPLDELGFTDAGAFGAREVPGLLMRALVQIPESAYALVYEHPQAGVWLDFYSRYQDGTTLTYSNQPQGAHLDQRPGHGKTTAPGLEGPALWARFLAERPQRPLEPVSAEAFVAVFEQAYADSMDWRNARGYSDDEVRRVLADGGDSATDEDVVSVREHMNQQARENLEEGLRERFLRETNMPAAEWEEVRDSLIFIHDGLSHDDLEALVEDWMEGEEAWPSTSEGLSARAAFAAFNELLPRPFPKLGELKEPLPVDVYSGYTDEDGDDEDENDEDDE